MAKGLKTGGRKQGTPNKGKLSLMELIESKYPNYNPVMALCDIANDPEVDVRLRIYCNKEVARYTHAPLKATEPETYSDVNVTFRRKEAPESGVIVVNESCKKCDSTLPQ